MVLLSWFLSGYSYQEPETIGLKHLNINGEILNSIEELALPKLLAACGKFFHYLWNQIKSVRGWKGIIVYKKMTPPCFERDVAFPYGTNDSSSIPCKYSSLPRKGVLCSDGMA